MTFVACYIHRIGNKPRYYRQVYADTINEATLRAEKYTKKGYMILHIVQKELSA